MIQGIALLGLNGGGKSTLAHALAKELGYFEMDVEDYYFPEQKESRQNAIEKMPLAHADDANELPFTSPRTKSEVEEALRKDIATHPQFVLSGVTMNWSEAILSAIGIAFLIETPLDIRLRRIREREIKRFGDRVLPGGDMYDQQQDFLRAVASKDNEVVYTSAKKLRCPVIRLDGTETVGKNIKRIMESI